MKKLIVYVLSVISLVSCNNSKIIEEAECSCPHATIILQPYGKFSKAEVNKILPLLQENLNEYTYGSWEYKILDPISITLEKTKNNRYRANDFLISQYKRIHNSSEIIIGLTHEDICTNIHNIENYGILGYSFKPGQVCIVSDKRLSNKNDIWKVVFHEFMHAYYGASHCPNDDPECFMKDAKGHGNIQIQNKLCNSCRQ